ncbi:hypothetical protein AMTR_s00107p00041300 [Amborella trichopoda]|uniref:AB hydrolase-1 domain-containing protein n=2 Tax=Amborella trichopoda TaxID=13333 RepID=W1NY53_AMBTC|nr:hypothetical protein AMTR_s00107p00041300 [Amborella trichopoda]
MGLLVMDLVALSRPIPLSVLQSNSSNLRTRRVNRKLILSKPLRVNHLCNSCSKRSSLWRTMALDSGKHLRAQRKYSVALDFLRESVSVDTPNTHIIRGDEGFREIGVSEKALTIPGLPDECLGTPIASCFWVWKPKFTVHYEKAGSENVNSPALLFLPGFGVGSFHFEKQLKDLGRQYRVWAVDFLGQGLSLPSEDPAPSIGAGTYSYWGFGVETQPWASDLVYSVDLWRDQIQTFVEEVIGEPVYVVGNSLGGFVGIYFAACYPHLVKGITLLNATPFWGFLPNPKRSPTLAKLFPWAGTFPLPANVRKFMEFVWQKVSDPESIKNILEQVYVDHSTKIDKVFSRILETTQHPAAAASFASIMFAPKGELSFQEALYRCQKNGVSICLIYGRDDPWVRPIWGLKVKQRMPETPYYELSPAGHCPHDEVPEVVNYLLRGWIGSLESRGSMALPLLDDHEYALQSGISRDVEFDKEGKRKSVQVRFFGSNASIWNQLSFYVRSWIKKLGSRLQ